MPGDNHPMQLTAADIDAHGDMFGGGGYDPAFDLVDLAAYGLGGQADSFNNRIDGRVVLIFGVKEIPTSIGDNIISVLQGGNFQRRPIGRLNFNVPIGVVDERTLIHFGFIFFVKFKGAASGFVAFDLIGVAEFDVLVP